MYAEELLQSRLDDKKITVSEVSVGMGSDPTLIRRSLAGKRHFKSRELILLCKALGVGIQDLIDTDGWLVEQ